MQPGWLSEIALKDWQIKLICLVLSIALWLFVHSAKISTLKINVPLEITGLSENLIYAKEPPRFAKVYIRGKKEYLKLATTTLKASIKLDKAKPGRNSYEVSFEEKQLPSNVKLVSVSEETIILERKVEKQLIVTVNLKGETPSGYKLGKISANPSKLKFRGPVSRMSRLYQVVTKPIDISGKDKDIEKIVEIERPHPLIKNVDINSVRVFVKILKAEMQNEISLSDIEVKVLNLGDPARFEISPKFIQATIQGPRNLLGLVKKENIYAFIDLINGNLTLEEVSNEHKASKKTETDFDIPVQFEMLRYQEQLTIVRITPPQIKVKLVKPEKKIDPRSTPKQESKNNTPSPLPNQ